MDILTAGQFTKDDVENILTDARDMRKIVRSRGYTDTLKGKVMTALFYEPSSRTFGSFIAAMQRLGGGIIPLQGVAYSSVSKGESFEDTVRTFASYSDVLVLRYPHAGGAAVAASVSDIPVVNAGDGNGEHPTQALLDMMTITDHMPSPDGLTISFVGDLLNGRTVHSLSNLLSLYSPKTVNFVSPDELRIPEEYVTLLQKKNISVVVQESLDGVLAQTDVLYVTRVQKERFRDLDLYERLKHHYIITPETLSLCGKHTIVMHPFPRIGEIAPEVDADPRAVYLREQIPNGMYVRMAVLTRAITT